MFPWGRTTEAVATVRYFSRQQRMQVELLVSISLRDSIFLTADPDMFNGYVWQTRTLEVRPDRLPADIDQVLGIKPSVSWNSFVWRPFPTPYYGVRGIRSAHSPTAAAIAVGACHSLSMQAASLATHWKSASRQGRFATTTLCFPQLHICTLPTISAAI
jgi:hypothetical protein